MRCSITGTIAVWFVLGGSVGAAERKPKLYPAGSLAGPVRDISADGKSIKIEVEISIPKVGGNGRITIEKRKETVELLFADEVKVRVPVRPERDENGKLKPYKPDPSDKDYRRYPQTAPGSTGDILKGHIVKIDIGQTKPVGRELPRQMVTVVVILGEETR